MWFYLIWGELCILYHYYDYFIMYECSFITVYINFLGPEA